MYVSTGPAAALPKQPPDKQQLVRAPPDNVLCEARDSPLLLGGSDGETSDYQRSTPSPRDSVTSSEDKCEDPVCWKDGLTAADSSHHQPRGGGHRLASVPSSSLSSHPSLVSPDLGFVDCDVPNQSDVVAGDNRLQKYDKASSSTTVFCTQNDDDGSSSANQSLVQSELANSLPKSLLLNKKLSVQIQKLPKMVPLVVGSPAAAVVGQHKLPVRQQPVKARFDMPRTKGIVIPHKSHHLITYSAAVRRPGGGNMGTKPTTANLNISNNSDTSSSSCSRSSSSGNNAKFVPTKIFYNKRPTTAAHTNLASETKNLVQDRVVVPSEPFISSQSRKFVTSASSAGASTPSAGSSSGCISAVSSECGSEHSSNLEDVISDDTVSRSQSPAPHNEGEEGNALLTLRHASRTASSSSLPDIHSDNSSSSNSLLSSSAKQPSCDVGVGSPSSSSSSGVSSAASSASSETARPFRFPTLIADRSAIPCKWEDCGQGFKSHARLSDHIKTVHMLPQLVAPDDQRKDYCCLWQGCKVFGAKSSSASWLQKHVPLHGGKLTFPCIVEGCKNRFSSQLMLERHVNSHFPETSSGSSGQQGARKSTESVPVRSKVLKRAGVKLKFRKLPFSARIFDFFDAGIMAGIRHQVCYLQQKTAELGIHGDEALIDFTSTAISLRLGESGRREVQLRWSPPDMLPDEWVPLDSAPATKSVKMSQLPETAKNRLQEQLNLKQRPSPTFTKHPRKRKQGAATAMTSDEPLEKRPSPAARANLAKLFL